MKHRVLLPDIEGIFLETVKENLAFLITKFFPTLHHDIIHFKKLKGLL